MCIRDSNDSMDQPGPYTGKGNQNEWGERFVGILERIMNSDSSVFRSEYDRGCHLEYPGGISGHSYNDAEEFWMGLRSSMPSAKFTVEHQSDAKMNSFLQELRFDGISKVSMMDGGFLVNLQGRIYMLWVLPMQSLDRGD